MSQSRFVHFSSDFFKAVDAQLPVTRTGGLPSRVDFIEYELPAIREVFATRFDELPRLIPERADYREVLLAGLTVYGFSVLGQLLRDGTIEVLSVAIDTTTPWPDDETDGSES